MIDSVVLPNVPERLVEQVLIFDLVLDVDHPAERFLYLALSCLRALPARKTDGADDLVYVRDDSLHDPPYDVHGCDTTQPTRCTGGGGKKKRTPKRNNRKIFLRHGR